LPICQVIKSSSKYKQHITEDDREHQVTENCKMLFEKNLSVHATIEFIFQHCQMDKLFQFISGPKSCIFTREYY